MKIVRNKRAFSLLEVLVAISLLLLLLLLLVGTSNTALNFWHHSQDQAKSASEARAVLQLLISDLRSAVLSPNEVFPKNYFFVSSDSDAEKSFLFFLAAFPREKRNSSDLGDLCAVGYFVSNEKTTYGQLAQRLYRFSLSSKATAQALKEGNLLEQCMLAASTNNPCCECVASHLAHFQATPIWYKEKQFSLEEQQIPPSLVEIFLETMPQSLSQQKKFQSWRTVVALHE